MTHSSNPSRAVPARAPEPAEDQPLRLRLGTRASRLALAQTRLTVEALAAVLPGVAFEIVSLSSPGDRDPVTDLRNSAPDFFTRDLDAALLDGRLDAALHSAKDVPDPIPDGLDWFWLPWREESGDALILRPGETPDRLPAQPIAGVSSERRAAYCRTRFPGAILASMRGNMDERIAKLDAGQVDLLIAASAGLNRIGLAHRITERIPVADLPTPDGQGALALVFRRDDSRLLALRGLFVKAVAFVGAGPGEPGLCTVDGRDALEHADVCLFDALASRTLLDWLPPGALALDVGKRAGENGITQSGILELLARYARRGLATVRLKGGDPGLFSRLQEEVDGLDRLRLPYRVIPGVSSLTAATTGTGLLLTRRGVSRGFTALSPVGAGGQELPAEPEPGEPLSRVYFMGVRRIPRLVRELRARGLAGSTPCALVLNAGCEDEDVLDASLDGLEARLESRTDSAPGLLLVGPTADARYRFGRWGAFRGRRILLTCSPARMPDARRLVRLQGGVPVSRALFRRVPDPNAEPLLSTLASFDWLVVSSPSAAEALLAALAATGRDVRTLPRLLAAGAGTAARLRRAGLVPDLEPESGFGSAGILDACRRRIRPPARLLRLRSDAAGPGLAEALRGCGCEVVDAVLYRNERLGGIPRPAFDAAFFASASAAEACVANWGAPLLAGKPVAAIGRPTADRLEALGVPVTVTAAEATVEHGLAALAAWLVNREMTHEPVSDR